MESAVELFDSGCRKAPEYFFTQQFVAVGARRGPGA
jgi:hypothetical protein